MEFIYSNEAIFFTMLGYCQLAQVSPEVYYLRITQATKEEKEHIFFISDFELNSPTNQKERVITSFLAAKWLSMDNQLFCIKLVEGLIKEQIKQRIYTDKKILMETIFLGYEVTYPNLLVKFVRDYCKDKEGVSPPLQQAIRAFFE